MKRNKKSIKKELHSNLIVDQEEDDLERIKEESRRRRQTILEKYKMQQQQLPKLELENNVKNFFSPVFNSCCCSFSRFCNYKVYCFLVVLIVSWLIHRPVFHPVHFIFSSLLFFSFHVVFLYSM